MLDTIQAALHFTNGFVYFFKGNQYVKWKPGPDAGVVTHDSGRVLRRLGVDGWRQLPAEFHSGIDAAFYYPPVDAVYFFKGTQYVKWKDGGPVTMNGSLLRTIGVDGWQTLPPEFRLGFDAVVYHAEREHAYFFKGNQYVKYNPNSGVVTASGNPIRQLGITGWRTLPLGFHNGVDAVMYFRRNRKIYFFKGRQYARWNAEDDAGLDARYPRRIGLRHGSNTVTAEMIGGWPGLSHVIAGPLVGHTTEYETRVWVWLSDQDTANQIQVQLNGQAASFTIVDPVSPELRASVQAVQPGSVIRQFIVKGLRPNLTHRVDLRLGKSLLESVQVRTPSSPSDRGDVNLAFISCTRYTTDPHAAPVLKALSEAQPDLTLFCGDNCYYVDGDSSGSPSEPRRPVDWWSTELMLRRQIQGRNYPETADLLLRGATFSTWDDHDFGFNNAAGSDLAVEGEWVGREPSSQVFRAFWPNDYSLQQSSIRHAFRWGPVQVFMTDSRFDRDKKSGEIWGANQLNWLLEAMHQSDAPLKIVVMAEQFLKNIIPERQNFIDGIQNVRGRILILSGDVHYTSLVRARKGNVDLLEFTSSAAKMGNDGNGENPSPAATRIWARRRDTFGLLRISINSFNKGRVLGQVILEARDGNGQIIMDHEGNRPCRTTWNLDTDEIS
jgi:PhoD-like phosphatase/Hemopexin